MQMEQPMQNGNAVEAQPFHDHNPPIDPDLILDPSLRNQTAADLPSPRRKTRSQTSGSAHSPGGGPEPVQDHTLASSSKRTLDQVETGDSMEPPYKSQHLDPGMPYDPEAAYLSDNRHPQLPGQYTFLASSPSTTVLERRGPRTRTAQPVPVPNLTKKSRGRRVPTKTTAEKEREKEQEKAKEAGQKAGRVYVCKVEDCGKCFNRGEHLKRHVRSIHTHEKPFKCSYPNCDKFFNRHDNLLQHQKVHKDFANPSDDPDHRSSSQRLSPTSPAVHEEHLHVFRGAPPRPSDPLNMPYSTFPTYQSGPTSPMGFATNMAVSSLRTELPPSADGPQNGEARFYHAGPYEPESPLAQHRPFPAGPPLQMQPTEQHAVYP